MRKRYNIFDCSISVLNKIHNRAGNLTVVEKNLHIPYPIPRVYYLYDVPGGASRGGHAHKKLKHFFIAASGSFEVVLKDGINIRTVDLNRPYYGLSVMPGIWSEVINFSSGAICLVLASHKYDEDDYIRDFEDYLKYINENTSYV